MTMKLPMISRATRFTLNVVIVLVAALLLTLLATRSHGSEAVIKIVAQKFKYTPNEIVLQKGQTVVLEFTALDFEHGFNIPDLHLRADLPPDKVTRLVLTPQKAGVFEFACDNFCGDDHEDMAGRIIVKE
jgi:cytochrome c oxidase subunit II